MPKTLLQKIEKWLYAKGFALPAIRMLLGVQLLLCLYTAIAGVLLSPLTLWPLTFCAGACIAAYNFWFIARFVQKNFSGGFSSRLFVSLFGGFNLRLLLTGVILFVLIAWVKVPLAPLVTGLTSLVVIITIWGSSRLTRKPFKEA